MTGAAQADTSPVDAAAFREAMARLASAVHLITTEGSGGRAGFTASAVCSVSDAPPTLLVCINRSSSSYAAFSSNEVLCVNTLGAEHQDIASAFGGKTPMAERFAAATWQVLQTGAPVLADALVSFDCRIVDRHGVGTHDVLYCAVQAVSSPGGTPALVYADRRYQTLPKPEQADHAPVQRSVGPRSIAKARTAMRSA